MNYDMEMSILSGMELYILHEMDEFQNPKNDKLYEMCFDKIKDVASFHRDNWQNELYFGPSRCMTHTQKTYSHFIVFLAECLLIYKFVYLLPKHYIFDHQKKSLYGYLADQGILGLCCKLYPKFLPDSEYVINFESWMGEGEGVSREFSLSRPCWIYNFNLIAYDRFIWTTMYPDLKFSMTICNFIGYNIIYIKQAIKEFKDENIWFLINRIDQSELCFLTNIILNHIILVFTSLKDILNSHHKKCIKQIKNDTISNWAINNL